MRPYDSEQSKNDSCPRLLVACRIDTISMTLSDSSLVPNAFMVYFYFRGEFFSSAVALFWAGQNFLGISTYIKDAQAMELPLVSVGGGADTIHDWNYILSKIGILRWDRGVGTMALFMGVIVMVVSVIWATYNCIEQTGEDTDQVSQGSTLRDS